MSVGIVEALGFMTGVPPRALGFMTGVPPRALSHGVEVLKKPNARHACTRPVHGGDGLHPVPSLWPCVMR